MIDHMTIGIRDFERSMTFYDAALAPLGVSRLVTLTPDAQMPIHLAGYGDSRPWLWLAADNPTQGKLHIALSANNRAEVDAFYAAALEAGAQDNGAPGLRPYYHPDYYGAFVLDPDGHNLEAVCHASPND